MKKIFLFLFFIVFLANSYGENASISRCRLHGKEICAIREDVSNALFEAHQLGGNLFRTSFVFTPREAADYIVEGKCTYSEFSETFARFMKYCHPVGMPTLHLGQAKMATSFQELHNRCLAEHNNFLAHYEQGKINFDKGLYYECLADIQQMIEKSESWEKDTKKEKEALFMQGVAYLEVGSYSEAIYTLSKLIANDPQNKEIYFNRAFAYFEEGKFDSALSDYITSLHSSELSKIKSKRSEEFNTALMQGLISGGMEAAKDFFPSLCESAYGLGECLWCFAQEPLNSTSNFCNACYEAGDAVVEYLADLDRETLDSLANEMKELYHHFDQLSEGRKGQLIGYCIGKYGIDIFAGGATLKCAGAVKKLKAANRIANLEALFFSSKTREAIQTAALKHASKREDFFKNVKIHWDRQNKHVPGKHNYIEGRSIFEHPDAQGLVDKFAGKGKPIKNRIPGQPDYREEVNFGEFIGYHLNRNTGEVTSTTYGEIRYSKTGIHIVPTYPKGKL